MEGLWERFSQDRTSTVWADGQVCAGQFEQKLLPGYQMGFGGQCLRCGLRSLEETASLLEFGFDVSGCHEAEVPDPDKAFGQHVEEEATDKLGGRQVDASVRSGLLIVPGPEGDRLPIEGHESLVGDGHPVSVMAQVAEDVPGATERRFSIDDPFGSSEFSGEPFEDGNVSPMGDVAGEGELSLLEGLEQAIEELAADHLCQSADRDQEVVLGRDPSVAGEA